MHGLELGLHLAQRNQRQHWLRVLVRSKRAVGPKLVRCGKERPREILQVGSHLSPRARNACPLIMLSMVDASSKAPRK